MTWVLVIFMWWAPSVAITKIEGFTTPVACQQAADQMEAHKPWRAVCLPKQ